ncbi:Phosphatidylglycerol--prolipoprotein diacylglyceryl transferase [Stutzerimonas stutzeri]
MEGVALFVILWFYRRKPRPTMAVSGLFAVCYGIFRFIVEFVRVPDAQLGYLAFGWTMGQVLCVPMILLGVGMIAWAYKHNPRKAIARPSGSAGATSARRGLLPLPLLPVPSPR